MCEKEIERALCPNCKKELNYISTYPIGEVKIIMCPYCRVFLTAMPT